MGSETKKTLSPETMDALLRAHDGDCALLALWLARSRDRDLERAAGDLCMTRAQVDAAMEKLGRMLPRLPEGEVPAKQPMQVSPVLPPPEELPEYTAEEIHAMASRDSDFQAVVDCAGQILGRQLNARELGRMLGLYSHLGLSAEVLFVLLHFCSEISRGPEGAARKPTVNFIEKQAYLWVNQGITTGEAAEEYAERQRSLCEREGRVKHVLEIYDRSLTTAEKGYIDSWLEMGFEEDVIGLAYERTLDNIGKRQFSYINTILQHWHEAGAHTVQAVGEKDPGRQARPSRTGRYKPAGRGKDEPEFFPTSFDD